MKAARLIVMGTALAAAGGAGFLALSLMHRQPQRQIVQVNNGPKINLEQVLVAAKDIPIGTNIKPSMVRWQEWPQSAVAKGYITKSDPKAMESIKDTIARGSFFEGEPLRESKLVRSGRGYMSAILPAGQRAIATSISTNTSAGGFILPNDRVDVIMTRRAKNNQGGDDFITETILQNVRVLAIDQTIEDKNGESVKVGETATLQLTPKQAEVLTVAQQMADRLSLTLRSLEDSKSTKTEAAYHLLTGERGDGTVRVIKYGAVQDVLTGKDGLGATK